MEKRLLFLTPGLGKGGAETQLLKIAHECSLNDYNVMILALKPINNFSEVLGNSGLSVVFLDSWKSNYISNLVSLFKTISRFKPQIVIAFMFVAIIIARILKVRFKYKLISSVRNSKISAKWYHLFKLTSRLDDSMIFNSQASRLNFQQKGLVHSQTHVMNNAISIPPALNDKPLINESAPFVWISIAHFRPSKDYQTLLNAIPLIKEKNFRIDILGNINNLEWPGRMIKELDIEHKVRLLGFRANSKDYLEAADALVLSSFNEGMPNAILEAMAYSKPIVASNIDGIRELLLDCNCGFLFRQGNAEDLAEKMTRIMKMSREERLSMATNGRMHVEKYFADEIILKKWSEFIMTFA